MTHFFKQTALILPIIILMITACNLSAGASINPTLESVIITATPKPETNQEASESEVNTGSSSLDTSNTNTTTVNVNSNSNSVISNDNKADNLYYVRGDRPNDTCAVQATVTTNIRENANTSALIVGQLVGGAWVPVTNHSNGWYQVSLPNTPVNRKWISAEPTILDNWCTCTASGCTYNPPLASPTVDTSVYNVAKPFPIPSNICAVYPVGNFNVNIRATRSESSEILGRLLQGSYVEVDNIVSGWFSVDLPGTPVDGGYISAGPAQLTSNCSCTDISCTPNTTSQTCNLVGNSNVTIHTEPGNWSPVLGQMKDGNAYIAIAQSNTGWLQLQSGGWIIANYHTCNSAPTIYFDPPVLNCKLVNITGEIKPIQKQPETSSDMIARFGMNLEMGVIKRQGNWYQVFIEAYSNGGWVDGSNMTLSGACSAFQ